jgi:hypothetical protein
MADRGLVSAPNAAAGVPFHIGGQPTGFYPLGPETGLPTQAPTAPPVMPSASVESPLPPLPEEMGDYPPPRRPQSDFPGDQ